MNVDCRLHLNISSYKHQKRSSTSMPIRRNAISTRFPDPNTVLIVQLESPLTQDLTSHAERKNIKAMYIKKGSK
jgi:hypothetical protein